MLSRVFPLLLAFCALLAVPVRAQMASRITLDGEGGAAAPAEKVDGHGGVHIDEVSTPALEIYPAVAEPSQGTILIAPGGGYRMLAVNKEGRDVAALLNHAGWDAAVLLYPVNAQASTRVPALNAAEKAMTLLQKRGREFGLSTRRIGVMGFSAGGHLMARLAHETAPGGTAPAFLVLLYPAYLEQGSKLLDEVAPINAPVFLYVGDQDKKYYPSSVAYAAACKEKGIRCDYSVAPDAGHGFGLTANLPAGAREAPDKLRAFLGSLDGKP